MYTKSLRFGPIAPLAMALVVALVLAASVAAFDRNAPVSGDTLDAWIASQNLPLQKALEEMYPESEGYFVTGPLCPFFDSADPGTALLYHSPRVICPDFPAFELARTKAVSTVSLAEKFMRGGLLRATYTGDRSWPVESPEELTYVLMTPRCAQLLIRSLWYEHLIEGTDFEYDSALMNYLYARDTGNMEAQPPKAADFGLPDSLDFFAEPPDYVIEGYDNYKAYLKQHATIETDFARGLLAFVPSEYLMIELKETAPHQAWPNKEWPMLTREYRKFFERGGDVRVMQTLTREGFDTLAAGEYFFAVNITGKVRFGRELLREEVTRLEEETGRKVPRANHAFLFPGEPVLTAGAFFIERANDQPRITEVNAQSGHYFYSNVSATIREDISERSDHYLLTLGHFFVSLDSLGIPHTDVLIRKM